MFFYLQRVTIMVRCDTTPFVLCLPCPHCSIWRQKLSLRSLFLSLPLFLNNQTLLHPCGTFFFFYFQFHFQIAGGVPRNIPHTSILLILPPHVTEIGSAEKKWKHQTSINMKRKMKRNDKINNDGEHRCDLMLLKCNRWQNELFICRHYSTIARTI